MMDVIWYMYNMNRDAHHTLVQMSKQVAGVSPRSISEELSLAHVTSLSPVYFDALSKHHTSSSKANS
jgi:hypothetical protein